MSRPLPLGARLEQLGEANVVRFTLRAEDVRIEKQTVIAERVAVRKTRVHDTEAVRETVRREELVVNTGGDVERTQRLDVTQPVGPGAAGVEPPPKPAPVPWAEKIV